MENLKLKYIKRKKTFMLDIQTFMFWMNLEVLKVQ